MLAPSLTGPVTIGNMKLLHRIVMSPLTRLRMAPVTEAPRDLNVLYYEQRSSNGGLVITECMEISPSAKGYVRAPGLHTQEQVEGWKKVVSRVHEKGCYMFVQMYHAGRVSHPSLMPPGVDVIAPSPIKMAGQLYVHGGKKADYETPKEATLEDIKQVVADFVTSGKVAVEVCGFDGIEIHAGNGYLIQEFLAKKTNQRTDAYGGDVAGRCKLLLEIIDALSAAVGSDKVGLKLQPGVTFSDLIEPEEDIVELLKYLGPELSKRKMAYVCLSSLNSEPYYKFAGLSQPNVSFDVWKLFRPLFTGNLMINGGITLSQGREYVADGTADLVSYGALFISNANLPQLAAAGWNNDKLNHGCWNAATWYAKDPSKDAEGYTDWPLVIPESA